jgi:hypothetical protein
MRRKGRISIGRRTEILNKNFGICVYCNEAPSEQVDHVLPLSWKLNNSDENLVGACGDCNRIASNKVFESFEQKQAYIVAELKKRKWRNRRVALYTFMPQIIKKLHPPKPEPIAKPRKFKQPALTEKECSSIQKKLCVVIKSFQRGGKVKIYETIARQLSKIAGLSNGRVWNWNYIQSIAAGSTLSSRKFMNALNIYLEHFSPHEIKRFYFAGRGKFAMCQEKKIRYEMMKDMMNALGMKPVTFKRYMEVKRKAVRSA